MREQRRGRRIAMTTEERDEFLRSARVCRVASLGADGSPHNSALWFSWDGESLWLYTIVKSQRWTNFQRDPRVSILVDGGVEYGELQGVELLGTVETVGPAPRTESDFDPATAEAERIFGEKYAGGRFAPDGAHAWLRVDASKVVSWDFRKLAALRG